MAKLLKREFDRLCDQHRRSSVLVDKVVSPEPVHNTRSKPSPVLSRRVTEPRVESSRVESSDQKQLLEKIDSLKQSLSELQCVQEIQRQTEEEQTQTIENLRQLLAARDEELRYWKDTARAYASQVLHDPPSV